MNGQNEKETIRELVPAWKKTRIKIGCVEKKVSCSETAAKVLKALIKDDPYENFWTLFLDGQNQIIGVEKITRGTVNQASPPMRNIFTGALLGCATGIICGHNHPSGNTKPSDEDKQFTTSLAKTGELLGLKVLDHIIIGNAPLNSPGLTSHYSFADEGLI